MCARLKSQLVQKAFHVILILQFLETHIFGKFSANMPWHLRVNYSISSYHQQCMLGSTKLQEIMTAKSMLFKRQVTMKKITWALFFLKLFSSHIYHVQNA